MAIALGRGRSSVVRLVPGALNTKDPDRKTLGKALRIAKHFGARIQGDDGEESERPEDLALE
jgi:hypothetical protein